MKKIIIVCSVVFAVTILSGCNIQNINNNVKGKINSNYLGSDYKGNYVWGGAMNLAWNELNDNILHEKLKLKTEDKTALKMVDNFNNATFTKNDLDEASYYIKSGYGQETVNTINKESRAKFPSKSFNDLNIKLRPIDIISYAYFLKQVEYLNQFKEDFASFNEKLVKGFSANSAKQRANIKILKYWDDDKFIISLKLKDDKDELVLAKGFDMNQPAAIVTEIDQNNHNFTYLSDLDQFRMPKLHLDYHREYQELINKYLANEKFTDYYIAQMFENIKFDMDQKGARVENEGVILMKVGSAAPTKKPKIKQFILDKPFWVVMKRSNSQNPYFILGVNNTELMTKTN